MSKLSKTIANAIIKYNKGILNENNLEAFLHNRLDVVNVRIYREDKSILLPVYSHTDDACLDIYCTNIEYDSNRNRVIIHTGLHFELPEDYEMELRPRSSNTKHRWVMLNSPGTLDEGYRGELLLIFTPLDKDINLTDFPYKLGNRICQCLIRRREVVIWNEVDSLEELEDSDRGERGFGSTGK